MCTNQIHPASRTVNQTEFCRPLCSLHSKQCKFFSGFQIPAQIISPQSQFPLCMPRNIFVLLSFEKHLFVRVPGMIANCILGVVGAIQGVCNHFTDASLFLACLLLVGRNIFPSEHSLLTCATHAGNEMC